jgi:uncharacterized protein (DUF302 family)
MNQPTYSIKQKYNGTFASALVDITQALKEQGFGILTQINVKETLKKKLKVDYPNYVILGACNPPNAYKALQAEKEIGLLLPCNVIVYEETGTVYIGVVKPTAALTLSENQTVAKIAQEVESKLIASLHQAVKSERSQK